ncbi:MAG: HEAT repeat domain-containing protein [Deltaproteobacteria bacterium]|nr:HEAT repeat domain-containing protein [Deltaproteobacteria bacterium]
MNSSGKTDNIDTTAIDSLVETLNSKDGLARQHARHDLVRIGEAALPALIKAFENKGDITHWEVAKTLSQIGSPEAAEVLVETLEDKEFSVRWIAAEGLIHIGDDAVAPLVTALKDRPESVWLREGAHHVLHDLISQKRIDNRKTQMISPLLDALNHIAPEEETLSAATKALDLLKTS